MESPLNEGTTPGGNLKWKSTMTLGLAVLGSPNNYSQRLESEQPWNPSKFKLKKKFSLGTLNVNYLLKTGK